ncbi:MAG: magnesium chelatase [Candidatus Entotheonella factor]|uniref:Magnesium chelatase n=1 Tax=Entotheonella factor TaxID=1429438 RepID=W4LSX2_ENTF1|nr:MAG: magnesium chelatase [Candidatus Entotheonella factor]
MVSELSAFASAIFANVEHVIIGKHTQIELILVAMLCQGHVLLEDVPGTGKTMLARSVAVSMGIEFKRLQCTPDLLPNDIVGVHIFLPNESRFEFHAGPVFTHILLCDEINRATPRTQSALLEAMQERQITLAGETHPLPQPFLVLATQNPIEYEGTFPLPEAQLDRFLMRITMGYPALEDEREMLRGQRQGHPVERLQQVVDGAALMTLRQTVSDVHVDASLEDYILKIVSRTRVHPDIALGASPRGSLALYKASQALAALKNRDYVIPDDIKQLIPPVLGHRLLLKPEGQLRGRTAARVLEGIMDGVDVELDEPTD